MIIVLKNGTSEEHKNALLTQLMAKGLSVQVCEGGQSPVLVLSGDTSALDIAMLCANECVEDARRITEPYKAASRRFHPQDTHIRIGDSTVGEGCFCVIAGPCSVESEAQVQAVAETVKKSGATFLRGGAYKPRTSPYAFQGLETDGIALLLEAKKRTGLPIVTEIMSENRLDEFADVDVIQVGARNMQNYSLLKALGHSRKPVLLKRGHSNTLEELLMSAEYIMAGGNENIILCERGIRTFETTLRNTLDISAVPLLKKMTHLPVVVDPSHAAGIAWMVPPLAKAAIAAGADGLMIEVHNNPREALCDGAQSLNPQEFDAVMLDIKRRVEFENKTLN